jgi:RNA polymerase sigma-70 factor (ECF subfamily)
MARDNQTWIRHLSGEGPERDAALADLGRILLGGLRKALANHPRADDPLLEDAVQDTLIRLLERLDQFEGRSRFTTWATSIAIRNVFTELRRRRWKDVSMDQVMAADAPRPQHADTAEVSPATNLERQDLIQKMLQVIEQELTDRQREALLAEMRGVAMEEIARSTGSSRNAVYKLTHDARKNLKRGLEAAGYRADDYHAAFSN